ncbi:hypothetical protein EWM64_g5200 [Hericium alpestre]|uniref:F-box domain-containing protein n=1 Tax=Hericium alpestre TaxID=135208 RepID=A0A4Y9ZVI2_9AGAM|nr:hypothetical protein EWM64_g5200 [Hericium alpestre]
MTVVATLITPRKATSTSAMPYDSTASRVLAIPELLDLIFGYGNKSTNARCARVCKRWTELALDNMWRHLDELYHLFSHLVPYVKRHNVAASPTLVFARTPTQEDWARFAPYARRVRSLGYDHEREDPAHRLDAEVFRTIALSRTTMTIFPKLRRLRWLSQSSEFQLYHTLFMHEGVTEYQLYLGGQSLKYSKAELVSDIVGQRYPSLNY